MQVRGTAGEHQVDGAKVAVAQAYGSAKNINQTQSWQVGLQWKDAFIKGNALGMAYGDMQTGGNSTAPTNAYELFYKFQVTDNISVTPAFFWIDNYGSSSASTGGLVKTTFKF